MKHGLSPSFIEKGIYLLSPLIFGLLALTQKQDANWDLLNYHYYAGYAFFTGHWKDDFLPAGLQSTFEPLWNILVYLLIRDFPPPVVGFLFGMLQSLVFIAIFWISDFYTRSIEPPYRRLWIRLAASASGIYATDFLSELGNTMGDTFSGALVLVGLALILRARETNRLFHWVTSGVFFGVASGIKYTNGLYFLGILFALILNAVLSGGKKFPGILLGLSASGGFFAAGGFWILALWKRFGNPVFPLYNGIFHSPYWSNASFSDLRWFPKSAMEWVFYPFYFTHYHQVMELSVENYAFMVVYILTLFLLFFKFLSLFNDAYPFAPFSENERLLLLFFVASFAIWEAVFSYYRYLAPLEALAPLVIFVLLKDLFTKLHLVLYIGILVFMAFHIQYPDWGRVTWGKSYFGTKLGSLPPSEKQQGIVLVGAKPIAFVIPDLGGRYRFISIVRGESVPFVYWKDLLLKNEPSIYLLTTMDQLQDNDRIIDSIGLHLRSPARFCRPVINRMKSNIVFCKLDADGNRRSEYPTQIPSGEKP